MSKGLNNFLILIKREREEFTRIGIFLVMFSFFAFYSLRLLNFPIIFAATPTPSPPNVSSSPEPQQGGGTITFSSNAQPGASGELIKLLICKSNSNFCVWGAQWGYRRAITISNSGSNALTNYQVNITLDTASLISAGKMRSDCGDIRFVDANGNLLNYWIESGCNSATTKIWVKVPSIPASSSTTIYVYYGNPSATSLSNGDNTFDFFDDFLGTSLNTAKWYVVSGTSYTVSSGILKITVGAIGLQSALPFNLNSGYLTEARVQYNSNSEAYYSGVLEISSSRFTAGSNANADATILYMVDSPASSTSVLTWIGNGSASSYNIASAASVFTMALNTWYILGCESTPSTAAVWKDYSRLNNYAVSWAKNIKYLSLGAFHGSGTYNIKDTSYDWVRVRKYTSPEPTASIGAEVSLNPYDFVYNQSSAVSFNPLANYTCPSCTYSQNTYYGVAFSVNESVWTAFTVAQTFTCKMEASQSGSCSCTSNTQCYNPCNANWGSYYDGYCYNNKCYDAIPGSIFGLTQSCLAGTLLNHETSLGRYANVNGRLYYCKGSDNSTSPYPFVFNLSPGSSVGNCKCNQDGSWSCPTGIIPIRGGRIKIV